MRILTLPPDSSVSLANVFISPFSTSMSILRGLGTGDNGACFRDAVSIGASISIVLFVFSMEILHFFVSRIK